MPIYAYRCTNEECDHTTESIRKYDEADDELLCTECTHPMERFIDGAPVSIFKNGSSVPTACTALSRRRRFGTKKSED